MISYTKTDFDSVADFDSTVCGFPRDAYLTLLLSSSSTILLAKSSGSVDGIIIGNGADRINLIYAETIEIAHALLKCYVEKTKTKQVTLFTVQGIWECEPTKKRAVHRRHTRAVPSLIKWAKVSFFLRLVLKNLFFKMYFNLVLK